MYFIWSQQYCKWRTLIKSDCVSVDLWEAPFPVLQSNVILWYYYLKLVSIVVRASKLCPVTYLSSIKIRNYLSGGLVSRAAPFILFNPPSTQQNLFILKTQNQNRLAYVQFSVSFIQMNTFCNTPSTIMPQQLIWSKLMSSWGEWKVQLMSCKAFNCCVV